jgi:preprotein translocase subunit SecE
LDRERAMTDLVFVVLTVIVFAVLAACVAGAEKL